MSLQIAVKFDDIGHSVPRPPFEPDANSMKPLCHLRHRSFSGDPKRTQGRGKEVKPGSFRGQPEVPLMKTCHSSQVVCHSSRGYCPAVPKNRVFSRKKCRSSQ